MIPRKIVENLIGSYVYIYIRNVKKEFAGKLDSISDSGIVVLEDKYNNLVNIPISEIIVITERR
ncbi:MAG: hypothetical protein ACXAES_11180 [Promethearchaeota archaeon]|jgi:hypothetical protein